MKKKLIAVLTAGLLLSGCGSSAGTQGTGPESGTPAAASSGADPASFKTMGDIYAANPEERERGFMDTDYCYVFELDGTVYRARGTLTEEQRDALFDLQYDDPDYEEKYREISGPIAIEQFDNLTEMIPPQEELDKYVGKTGQNLLEVKFDAFLPDHIGHAIETGRMRRETFSKYYLTRKFTFNGTSATGHYVGKLLRVHQ